MAIIREVLDGDLFAVLRLYTHLHNNDLPKDSISIQQTWRDIMDDKNHHIVVAVENDIIISSCVIVIIQNLTHNQRPYALIENVITDEAYRRQGLATACLDYAKQIAKKYDCYKIMLLTGSKEQSTLNFYKEAGYNSDDKTAFIQWL